MAFMACVQAHGQNVYEYFYNDRPTEDYAREITADGDLFYIPLRGRADVFTSLSDFNFSAVRYRRRGYDSWMGREYWGNSNLSGLVSSMPDFLIMNALRRSQQSMERYPGLKSGQFASGLLAGLNEYSPQIGTLIPDGRSVGMSTHNRKGVAGWRVRLGKQSANDDRFGVYYAGRFGDDPPADGIKTNEHTLLAGYDKMLNADHRISLAAAASFSDNTLRSYAAKEAFALMDNNLYNPSWGYYGSEQVSANTSGRFNAMLLLNYEGRVSDNTTLTASASYRKGREKRGGIAWFDAQNPYPDYYRYMPGFEPWNLKESWTGNDTRVTQIFWEQMVEQNLGRKGEQAAYILESRTEDIDYFQLAVAGLTRFDRNFTFTYGIRAHHDRRTRYKMLDDLLHAEPIRDIDQYLLGDDLFGDMHRNDVRNPDRLVGQGDRFGYNYRLTVMQAEAYGILGYTAGKFRTGLGIEAGQSVLQREGLYEKEIFPGKESFGRSKRYVFNPYTVKLSAGYSFSARHFLDVSFAVAETAPYAGNIFLNPNYSNSTIDNPRTMRLAGTELSYSAVLSDVTFNVSAYATKTSRETAVYRYWDDIASAYCDMSVSGINKEYYGVEIGGKWNIGTRFDISVAASLGSYAYASDPAVTIMDDATRETYVANSKSRMKDYRIGSSPEHAVTGELSYNSRGWLASLSANYMGSRYVDATPLRRMERAYGLAGSPEQREAFVAQEKLDDAFTLDLFVLKSFTLGGGTITALASVSNLLGKTDVVYNAYEQMRVSRRGTDPNYTWTPFASKYLYSYGRTYYFSLTYTF